MNLIDLKGKKAIVTGGSRGIGRATAMKLASAGAEVGFTFHSNKEAAVETIAHIKQSGMKGWSGKCDLADADDIKSFFSIVDEKFTNGLDIFIANAGIWPPKNIPLIEMTEEQWRRTIDINLNSVFYATKEAGKRMRSNGRIILVGSTAGQRGEAYHADYSASKGALISLVKGLCIEFADRGITVNCVAPGWVDTDMSASTLRDETRIEVERTIPLSRIATAEDIAGPIVFLCSEMARHITGEVLNVNGGAVLCG